MSESVDLVRVEQALVDGVAAGKAEFDVITVGGADADEYLQGQLSQNVTTLAVGATRWSLLLQPQGKIETWMRIHRTAPDQLWLVTDAGYGDGALARLERFKLRVDVAMELERHPALALRGPAAREVADEMGLSAAYEVLDADWGPVHGVDIVPISAPASDPSGPDGDLPDPSSVSNRVVAADADAMELIRMLQGHPRMGRELDSSTIPAASGVVDQSVDFDKGCYVGQELVARIDSRGANTPTRLVRFSSGPGSASSLPSALLPGSAVVVDGTDRGVVTSWAVSPSRGVVGLAYVKRAVEVPGSAEVSAIDGASVPVELEPLVPSDPSVGP